MNLTGSKKNLDLTLEQKRRAIEPRHRHIAIYRQCELLGLSRSSLYYKSRGNTQYNEQLMKLIDKQYIETPFYGIDKMTGQLRHMGHQVNHNVFNIDVKDDEFDYCFVHDLFEHLSIDAMIKAISEICRTTQQSLCIGFFNMYDGD